MVTCAVIDDYQNVAAGMADWSRIADQVEVTFFHDRVATRESLVDRLKDFDIIAVMRERTRGLIGAPQLRRMKPSALLINTARAPIIDETALITALKERWIAGAGLDVFDEEPLPAQHPFRSHDNVVATPHLGFVTEGNYREFYGMIVEDIAAWLQGAPVRLLGEHLAVAKK
jgi:phosphoglycerate dehydrogenase-like enzyme